ncbi:MAG: AAA family ATPase [Actinobacteria bacterium]|nr:AAA family ATPase [Actinomycetota bacterium]
MPPKDAQAPRSVAAVLRDVDDRLAGGDAGELATLATGFRPLDRILGGGLHPGGLTVLGGAPGVGKTIMALQWARNLARDGRPVIYACYEHEEAELLLRLLALELDHEVDDAPADVTALALAGASAASGIVDQLSRTRAGKDALERLGAYADRLHLVRASGTHTGVEELTDLVQRIGEPAPVLFVDYLQKVRVSPEPPTEAEKVRRSTEGLKELALSAGVPVVAVVATERAGIEARRTRMHHFRGSSAMAFEADVALVLNEKWNAVAKVHLAYDPLRAATFRDWVVVSIEKNRNGPSPVDVEFRKDFEHFRFDPDGGLVTDQLVDERLDEG